MEWLNDYCLLLLLIIISFSYYTHEFSPFGGLGGPDTGLSSRVEIIRWMGIHMMMIMM